MAGVAGEHGALELLHRVHPRRLAVRRGRMVRVRRRRRSRRPAERAEHRRDRRDVVRRDRVVVRVVHDGRALLVLRRRHRRQRRVHGHGTVVLLLLRWGRHLLHLLHLLRICARRLCMTLRPVARRRLRRSRPVGWSGGRRVHSRHACSSIRRWAVGTATAPTTMLRAVTATAASTPRRSTVGGGGGCIGRRFNFWDGCVGRRPTTTAATAAAAAAVAPTPASGRGVRARLRNVCVRGLAILL